MKSFTLKIRGGVEVDSKGKKAGKGALIQEEKSATLGVSQDQILFQAVKSIGFMRGLGGVQTMNEKMPTLQAANGMSGNNKPCVAYGVATKGNGDAFVSEERHTSLTTGGGEPGQGYPCVMTAVGVDCYNIGATDREDAMKNYVTANLILDDQGGQQISVRTDGKSPTLRAEMHGNLPCVCSAGFKPSQGAKAKGMGFEMEKSPTLLAGQEPGVCITFEPGIASRDGGHVYENVSGTLRATPGDNQMTVVLENHPNDSRVKIDDSGTVQTLTSRCGTGGGNVPLVLEPVCFQQNQREEVRIMDVLGAITAESGMHNTNYVVFSKIRRAKTADDFETWGETGVCNTLNTFDNGDVRTNECVICLQGNGIDRADTAGCNGRHA